MKDEYKERCIGILLQYHVMYFFPKYTRKNLFNLSLVFLLYICNSELYIFDLKNKEKVLNYWRKHIFKIVRFFSQILFICKKKKKLVGSARERESFRSSANELGRFKYLEITNFKGLWTQKKEENLSHALYLFSYAYMD